MKLSPLQLKRLYLMNEKKHKNYTFHYNQPKLIYPIQNNRIKEL